jgi:hypothetical protein
MPGSTPLQLYQYPTNTDQGSPASIQTLAQAVEKQVVAVFPDSGTRDSRWTAATGLTNGAMCFLVSTGELQLRSGGAWVVIGGRQSSFAMASGTFTWSMTTVTNITVTPVNFPAGRFSQVPIVMATQNSAGANTSKIIVRAFNITTAKFDANMSTGDASALSVASEVVAWTAYQMTSAAAAG